MTITSEIYDNLEVGDIIISKCKDRLCDFPEGLKCPILGFYNGRCGVIIEGKSGTQTQMCMSNVMSYFEIPTPEDAVNHPSHYTWLKEKCGIEVIDITRHLDFDLGNAIKYILRAGRKPLESEDKSDFHAGAIQDLKKAIWYLEDKIKTLEKDS